MSSTTDKLQPIYDSIFEDKANIFLSGTGGCGKSYTLKAIYKMATAKKLNVEITSTTGISAYQINGRTIHSFAGFIFPNYIQTENQLNNEIRKIADKIKRNKQIFTRWSTIDILLIDEISMMGGNYFDMLNCVAQILRNNSLPFGGIQLVLSGDLLQLPPVKDIQVFESLAWDDLKLETFMLTTPWRFDDKKYIQLLQRIRLSSFTKDDEKMLQSRVISVLDKKYVREFEDGAVHIFSLKRDVDKYNREKLESVNSEMTIITSTDNTTRKNHSLLHSSSGVSKIKEIVEENKIEHQVYQEEEKKEKQNCCICLGDFKDGEKVKYLPCFHLFHAEEIDNWLDKNDNCPLCRTPITKQVEIEQTHSKVMEEKEDDKTFANIFPCAKYLHLKLGCKVMLLINIDVRMGLVNGSVGTVMKIESESITVKFNNNMIVDIPPHDFTYEDYEVVLTRRQFPLVLAYAISVHKSQGSTIDRMVVDLGKDIFANGQAYVALSRCKNLNSLMLKNFVPYKIKADNLAVSYEKRLLSRATIL